mmetsp:Transcript_14602/g.26264  ORF Transcript_14602/g.26264 Transcript_14602/m.26264 type:complete len:463 (+) Transcript_14602:174-1562(+)
MSSNEIKEVAKGIEKMKTKKESGIDPTDHTKTLVIQGVDNSAYQSEVKSFRDLKLKPKLIEALAGPMDWLRPSRIQGAVLGMLKDGVKDNIVAQGAFGSGKTGMFGLAMLNAVDESKNMLQCVCIAPARELATQIYNEVTKLAQYTTVRIFLAVRNCPKIGPNVPHIVVGTPGTIRSKFKKRGRKAELEPKGVKMLVIDEADEMLKGGDGNNLSSHTLDCAKKLKNHQVILVSATFPEEKDEKGNANSLSDDEVRTLKFMKVVAGDKPVMVRLQKKSELSQKNVPKYFIKCADLKDKMEFMPDLYDLQANVGQCIVFCNTRKMLPTLAKFLEENDFKVSILHGGLENEQRDQVVKEFKEKKSKMLLSTDVIAKGFNVPSVSVVVNFDIPLTRERRPNRENYLHRVGRAGRFGRNGLAINLITPDDGGKLEEVEKFLTEKSSELPRDDLDPLEKVLTHVKTDQ